MFAVGHLSLGYLVAKGCQKLFKTDVNLPTIFFLSLIPDVDLLIPPLAHRSITHSPIMLTVVFAPFFLAYGKKTLPYFSAILQHSLIGDFITNGGAQLLWPLSSHWYSLGVDMLGFTNVTLELSSFTIALIVMAETGDLKRIIQPHKSNILLFFPSAAIIASLSLNHVFFVPWELFVPHLIFLAIFALGMISVLAGIAKIGKER
jgi:membrane-bound metal-dependent hydrolase YbcI (DUF457 family)